MLDAYAMIENFCNLLVERVVLIENNRFLFALCSIQISWLAKMSPTYLNIFMFLLLHVNVHRECPDELKEAVSSLIFAASKCGEFQDLEKIRSMFTKRFGKEFANNAVDLCNNSGVCPKVELDLFSLLSFTLAKLIIRGFSRL